jgi:hypothetical protein
MDRGKSNGYRRWHRALGAPLLAAFVLLASAAAAQASTIVVNTFSDAAPNANECSGTPGATDCSLRQAVDKAQSGDIVQLPAGSYSLTLGSDIDITRSLTIEGDTTADTTIDGSQNTADGTLAPARILRVDGAPVTIENLTLTGGDDAADENCPNGCETLQENGGGALFNNGGSIGLAGVAFTNDGGGLGGAISTNGGSVSLTDVSFTDDDGFIGGALFARGGTVTGNRVTFYNDAPLATDNAAVYLYGGTASFTNTTVANNGGASSRGGGIDNGGAALTLINDTLSGNVRGALLTDQGASTTVENTIIGAGFSDGVDFACIAPGHTDDINDRTTANAVTTDGGHNIDQDGHCDLSGPGDVSGQDPMLVPIADNGGPTLTQALLAGSPALGDPATSDCPTVDQRGETRPSGKCDIGAVEAVVLAPPGGTPTASTGDSANVTDTSADLSATINLRGEAGGFHFVYGTSQGELTSSSPETAAGVVSSDTPETETLSNLSPGTTYYYLASADNATASTAASNVEQFTTAPGPPVISNVNVDSVTDTTATLAFSIDPQGGDTSYYVEYGPDSNYGQQTQPVDIGSSPGAQNLSVTLTDLSPGSSYQFQVVASHSGQQPVDSGNDQFATDVQITGETGSQVTVTNGAWTDGDCPTAANTTVDWGDGTSDTDAQIECNQDGSFTLTDTHTYASPGHYLIQIEYGDLDATSDEYAAISAPNSPPPSSPPPSSPPASNPSPPTVQTTAPAISITSAGFSGSVTPNGLATQAYFQYGLDPKYSGGGAVAYDQSTQPQSVGSDFASHSIGPIAVAGLLPNAVYHVRLVATNSDGTTFGPDVTFTTEAAAAPSAPTLGKTFNVAPVSGFVLIKIHGKFVPLTGLDQIPSGSQIDARHGSLELITSNGIKGKTQHGTFGGAIFKLTQQRSGPDKGLVTLTLAEGAFKGAPSYALCRKHKHKAGDASAAAVSSKVLQLLHASAHGKFRTSGRYSAATVRGTIWTVADRCDGTLTHDVTDSVAVKDFVHHRTIILHAGQSYLALAPK